MSVTMVVKLELPGPGQYAANDDEAWQAASNNLSALAHKANQDATVIEQQLSWAETTRQAGLTVRVGQCMYNLATVDRDCSHLVTHVHGTLCAWLVAAASAQLLGPVPTFVRLRFAS